MVQEVRKSNLPMQVQSCCLCVVCGENTAEIKILDLTPTGLVRVLYASHLKSAVETAEFCFCSFRIDSMVKTMLRKLDKCNIGRNWTAIENHLKFIVKTVLCMKSRNKEALVYQTTVYKRQFLWGLKVCSPKCICVLINYMLRQPASNINSWHDTSLKCH